MCWEWFFTTFLQMLQAVLEMAWTYLTCFCKYFFDLKVTSQMSHFLFFMTLWTFSLWIFRRLLVWKRFPQIPHVNDLAFLDWCACLTWWFWSLTNLLQILHADFELPWNFILCLFKSSDILKVASQMSQLWFFKPTWCLSKWMFSYLCLKNTQTSWVWKRS